MWFYFFYLFLWWFIVLWVTERTTASDRDDRKPRVSSKANSNKISSQEIYDTFRKNQISATMTSKNGEVITTDNARNHNIIYGAVSSAAISKEKLDIYIQLLSSSSSASLIAINISTELTLIDVEYLLALKEYERSTAVYHSLLETGDYEIYGMYHVSARKQFWKEVIQEQLLLLDGRRKFPKMELIEQGSVEYVGYEWDMEHVFTSLLALSSGVYVNAAVESMDEFVLIRDFIRSLPLRNHDKIVIGYNVTVPRHIFGEDHLAERAKIEKEGNHSTGEFGSVMLLHGFCKHFQHQQDLISFRDFASSSSAAAAFTTSTFAAAESLGNTVDDEKQYVPAHYTMRSNYRYGGIGLYDSVSASSSTSSNGSQSGTKQKKKKQKGKKKSKKAMVFYMHNKGACCRKGIKGPRDPVAAWREMMNTFNVEFPSICLRAIGVKKYATCGTEYQDAHYSGNYWWSDCEHLAQLPPLAWPLSWGDPEFFIGWFSDDYNKRRKYFYHCAYSAYHTVGELYTREYPRQDYLSRLWVTVMQTKLPTSWGNLPVNMTMKENHLKYCKAIRNPILYKALIEAMPEGPALLKKYKLVNEQGKQERLVRRGYFGMDEVIEYYSKMENKIPAALLKSTTTTPPSQPPPK